MWEFFQGVWRYVRPYRLIVGLLLLGLSFESLFDVAVRFSLKFVIDNAIVEGDLGALVWILVLLAIGAVIFNVLVIGCDYIWAKTGGRIINDIRFDLFQHMQRQPVGFFRSRSTGDLTARFNADAAVIEYGLVLAVPMAVMGIVEIVASLALMAWLHPVLFLIAALGIVLSLAVPRFIQRRALEATFSLRVEEGKMTGYLQENITAQTLVKAYGLEAHAGREFRGRLDQLLVKLARANFLSYLVSRLPGLSFLLLQLVVLGVGGYLAVQGEITVGSLVSYQALLIGLNTAIYNLTWMIPSFIDAAAGFRRIKEVLDEPPKIVDRPGAIDLPRVSQGIEFQAVNFGYENATTPTLHDMSFRINRGDYVVIVGQSGAGKSSIVNLLMRFHDVDSGSVRFDGQDVRDVTLSSLRGQIGLVSQEVSLFDISIRDNIRLGRLDATDEEIVAAARGAEIHDRILQLPQGYDTRVGEGGSRLSGGERQRVALARALVRQPAVLLLDEVTSALDPQTEAGILKTIERLRPQVTIISVTHRLIMAKPADRILVAREGRIVEQGKHRTLMAKKDVYAGMWAEADKEPEDREPPRPEPPRPEPRREARPEPKPDAGRPKAEGSERPDAPSPAAARPEPAASDPPKDPSP